MKIIVIFLSIFILQVHCMENNHSQKNNHVLNISGYRTILDLKATLPVASATYINYLTYSSQNNSELIAEFNSKMTLILSNTGQVLNIDEKESYLRDSVDECISNLSTLPIIGIPPDLIVFSCKFEVFSLVKFIQLKY